MPDEYLNLHLQLTGRQILKTSRDEVVHTPGKLYLNYCNQPLSFELLPGEPYTMIGLFFKKSSIAEFLKPSFQNQNLNLSHHSLGPALIGCMSVLNRRHLIASEKELNALYSASISLAAASFIQDEGFIEDVSTGQTRVRDGILNLIKHFVDDHIRETSLSPAIAAARFGISVRYIHKLFAATDQSFGDYVLVQRLEQSKSDLQNPAFDRLSVAEIGYGCGFKDLSNFYRNFKIRFGITPGQMRLISNQRR
jgi:AraC-like DNA-binding protein